VPIIRINNCIYATLGACYCVWIVVCVFGVVVGGGGGEGGGSY
jgi:hypothetical protein